MPAQEFDYIDYLGPVVVGVVFSVISFIISVFINFFCITKTDDVTVFEKLGSKYNIKLGPHPIEMVRKGKHIWSEDEDEEGSLMSSESK